MRLPRVLIVDDHRLFAEGLSHMIKDRFEIVGTITDGRLLLDAVRRLHPDVVLLDMSMPQASGLDLLLELKAKRVECRTIVLTMHADPRMAADALKAGAAGYVLKESSHEELVAALDAVLQARTYLTTALTKDVLALMAGPSDPESVELTPRQREVLRLIVQGQRVKEIAAALNLSPRTVESIKYRMMQELNVQSTAGLVRYAIQHNIVTPEG
jgi:DNA-binding NarL/FixJ family response regulator